MTKDVKNPDLSDEQKAVLFDKATEAPFSGALVYTFDTGDYVCANCGSKLFTSHTKFDAGCGWPSFDQAVEGSIITEKDTTHGMVRTEIMCAQCGGHLGHVFDDGPKETTGLRYCVNSLSLQFTPKK
ncbi:peptide-methionine (R)-S-oxide reductase [Candidatus Saccharibacteria bacterium 49-20]|nr:MAG: peptide-methionine (R)-S-oxide reductase [Candidatus Saccharibacteria bacterium 49-20]